MTSNNIYELIAFNKGGSTIMKIKVIFTSIFILFISFVSFASAYQIATTADGKKVKLFKDGTYSFIENKKTDGYEEVDFVDFLVDAEQFLGKKITVKGSAWFRSLKGNKRRVEECGPHGSLYKRFKTLGSSISFCIPEISKAEKKQIILKELQECPIALSGVVKNPHKWSQGFIEVHSIKFLDEL